MASCSLLNCTSVAAGRSAWMLKPFLIQFARHVSEQLQVYLGTSTSVCDCSFENHVLHEHWVCRRYLVKSNCDCINAYDNSLAAQPARWWNTGDLPGD